jgi:hypothetical protein
MTGHLSDDLLSAHVDGELSPQESSDVAAHLFSCSECSTRLERLRATSRAVSSLPVLEPPRPLDLGFLAAPRRRPWLERILPVRPPTWVAPAAAIAAVLLIGVGLVSRYALLPTGNQQTAGSGVAQRSASGDNAQRSTSGGTGSAPAPGAAAPPSPSGGEAFNTAPTSTGAPRSTLDAPGSTATRAGARSSFDSAGGLSLALVPSARTAPAGRVVRIQVEADGGARDLRLGSAGITLYAVHNGVETPLGGIHGSGLLIPAHQARGFTVSYAAGWSARGFAAGDYSLLVRAVLEDGTVLPVSVAFPVT